MLIILYLNRIFVLATTSKVDNVPSSLRRPGRLDLELELPVPDVQAREEILNLYLETAKHLLTASDIKLIARVCIFSRALQCCKDNRLTSMIK